MLPGYEDIRKINEKTYDLIADQFSPLLSEENGSSDEIAALDKLIGMLPDKAKIADLGCGVGKHGRYCAKKGIELNKGFVVFGFDISRKMIDLAEKYNHESGFAEIKVLEIADMAKFDANKEYGKYSFDAVIMAYSLIHLDKRHATLTLKNLKKHLNNHAVLFITVYKGDRNYFCPEILAEKIDPTAKTYYRDYYMKEFKELVNTTGYRIVFSDEWYDSDDITAGVPENDDAVLCIIATYDR